MKSHLPYSFCLCISLYIAKLYMEKQLPKLFLSRANLIVSLPSQVKLSSLNLDDHARKKMLKLVGERYCKDTDVLTITTDR